MPIMWSCEHISTIDSTQREILRRINAASGQGSSDAKSFLSPVEPSRGLALWTLRQTQGLGSHARRWHDSPQGGFACSMAWPEDQHALPLSALPARLSLLVLRTLERTYPVLSGRLGLKWPNDLLVGEAKLAGILVSRHQVAGVVWLIAGIGINLFWALPPSLDRPVTDLKSLGVDVADPAALAHAICADIQAFRSGECLGQNWEQEFMRKDTLAGSVVDVVHPATGDVLHRGVHAGITALGQLLLESDRSTIAINIGELSLRRGHA